MNNEYLTVVEEIGRINITEVTDAFAEEFPRSSKVRTLDGRVGTVISRAMTIEHLYHLGENDIISDQRVIIRFNKDHVEWIVPENVTMLEKGTDG